MPRSIFIIFTALLTVGCERIASVQFSNYRETINNAVKDPGSTEFRNERVSSNGTYCAEVNSKNSYGAFVGFERVITGPSGPDGKRIVFFEREGAEGDGDAWTLIQARLLTAALKVKNDALERELNGGDKATLREDEYQKLALRRVFDGEWSANCPE